MTTDLQAPPPDTEDPRLVNGRFDAAHAGDLAAVRMRKLFRRPALRRVLEPVADEIEEVASWR